MPTSADELLTRIKAKLDTRLDNYLAEMKEGHDDSVVGFNEAWDVMRAVLSEVGETVSPNVASKADFPKCPPRCIKKRDVPGFMYCDRCPARPDAARSLRLPWRVHLVDSTMVIDADGNAVVSVHGDYETEWSAMEVRAAFLVFAANSHHAIKEALREMYDTACTNATSTPSKAEFLKARAAIACADPA